MFRITSLISIRTPATLQSISQINTCVANDCYCANIQTAPRVLASSFAHSVSPQIDSQMGSTLEQIRNVMHVYSSTLIGI